ncbi:MAG: L-threonylcarbamoyladenylate synthase [Solirubrobacteraceae bacterium]|jgi:L-threonylcarbamoyladenylate synthase|nr:L-threonylcarbamoyladenylate synthase [Solirubrobacteraceae bacterium]
MSDDARALEACVAGGGVAVFYADTVYGLACDPEDAGAVARLYALKGRPPRKASAVMWLSARCALAGLPELGPRMRAAFEALLPGAVTLLVPNPRGRFPLACGADGAVLGVRVPDVPALAAVARPLLQSSANLAGAPDARRLDEVPESIRSGADLVLDGGTLAGTPSTVVDLTAFERAGSWQIVRPGLAAGAEIAAALGTLEIPPPHQETRP